MNLLGETLKGFDSLSDVEKTSFVLGCELWEENIVKEYISDLWEVRKVKCH